MKNKYYRHFDLDWKGMLLPEIIITPKENHISKQKTIRINQKGGTLPIGNRDQYNNVVSIYQSLVSKGVDPQAALDLVNQKVAEKGWTGYSTGDNKKFNNVDQFTDHLIDWHRRMFPDSLKANNFNQFWKGIMVTPKYKYNPRGNAYKQELLRTRPGVKKRINFYRKQQGLSPLALVSILENNMV